MIKKFRVVDVETTGTDLEHDHICSIAWVDVDSVNGITDQFYSLIDPGKKIPAEASAIHHITNGEIVGAPQIGQVWSVLLPGNDRVFVAHNAKFDMGMLRMPEKPAFCTLRAARHLWPEAPNHKNMTLRYWLDLRCESITGMPAHRADVDAMVTAELILRILEHEEVRELDMEALLEWCNRPIEMKTIPFGKHKGQPWNRVPVGYLEWMRDQLKLDPDTKHNVRQELKRRMAS